MAVEAERRRRLGEVIVEFRIAALAGFVDHVARLAAHVQRGMAAAFVGDVQSLGMAGETNILVFVPRGRLDQLIFVVGLMRIVTLDAVTNGRRMNLAFDVGSILVGMTGEAECTGGAGGQLDVGCVLVDANLMTTGAAHRDGRMNKLAFGLVFMTPDAFGRVGVFVQWNWMDGREDDTRTHG